MHPSPASYGFLTCILSLALASCTPTALHPLVVDTDAGVMETEPDAEVGCEDGSQVVCACDHGGVGMRTCQDGEFAECEACMDAGSENQKLKCVAGIYRGHIEGMYKGGIPGVVTLTTIPIAGDFRLNLTPPEIGEFATVGDACITFQASDAGTSSKHAAVHVSGSIDCTTGELNAVLRGKYTVDFINAEGFYMGTFKAKYDPETKSFKDGVWVGDEPPDWLGDKAGGGGTFDAMLTDEPASHDPEAEDVNLCLGSTFPEQNFH
ncbi:MAG: hypothetical protein QM778_23700 [Myxococcales bacterium]